MLSWRGEKKASSTPLTIEPVSQPAVNRKAESSIEYKGANDNDDDNFNDNANNEMILLIKIMILMMITIICSIIIIIIISTYEC